MNLAVRNENGPLAGDPLSTKRNCKAQLNNTTFRRKGPNSVYPSCNNDIVESLSTF